MQRETRRMAHTRTYEEQLDLVSQLRPAGTGQAAWDAAVGALLSRVAYTRHLTSRHRPTSLLHAAVVLLAMQARTAQILESWPWKVHVAGEPFSASPVIECKGQRSFSDTDTTIGAEQTCRRLYGDRLSGCG